MQKKLDDRDKVQGGAVAEAVARKNRRNLLRKMQLLRNSGRTLKVKKLLASTAVAKAITEEKERRAAERGYKSPRFREGSGRNEKKFREMLIKSALAE